MNIDGYALIRINDKDEAKAEIEEYQFFDIRLSVCDFDSENICDDLVGQLPKGMKDVLVMCLFNYHSESSYDYWSGATEYEDCFDLKVHQVVKENYKEFYREQVTEELNVGINGMKNLSCMPDGENFYKEMIATWEEFYDEDFKPFEKPTNVKS